MKKLVYAAAAAAAILTSSVASAISTFAQFNQLGAADTIRFTNTAGTTGQLAQIGAPVVSFKFLTGPDELSLQDAYFSFSANATSAAQVFSGFTTQEISSGTISFTRVTPASEGSGNGSRTNLLTISFTNATIFGGTGSTAAALTASTTAGSTVTMTSDFFDFDNTINRDLSFSFSSVSPVLTQAAAGDNLRSFTADATGTFSSDPAPRYVVPEPTMIGLFGAGLVVLGFARRRRS